MQLFLYDLVPIVMPWKQNKTIVKGKYVEDVVIWKLVKFPVEVRLGAANDN